jgi:hypothetical protein
MAPPAVGSHGTADIWQGHRRPPEVKQCYCALLAFAKCLHLVWILLTKFLKKRSWRNNNINEDSKNKPNQDLDPIGMYLNACHQNPFYGSGT